MIRSLAALIVIAAPLSGFSGAAAAEDDVVVRLPGSGEVKDEARATLKADRLKPGGGLLASFDANANGRISAEELETGVKSAFIAADANRDGELTALEQQAWAQDLPTRDDSLANPVRFDPNLDRRVSFAEFRNVILNLASDYSEDNAELKLASLKAPTPERNKQRERIDEIIENTSVPPQARSRASEF
ncbi:EF-hand domain-containing protein [Henriciella sp. AS95]|uniref:EF-hand domain-containing protein n=1 Tax=Henriciella sp. AS95 TaxID=3135782 RepID=UPI0031703F50